jgi:hypothetical protein
MAGADQGNSHCGSVRYEQDIWPVDTMSPPRVTPPAEGVAGYQQGEGYFGVLAIIRLMPASAPPGIIRDAGGPRRASFHGRPRGVPVDLSRRY